MESKATQVPPALVVRRVVRARRDRVFKAWTDPAMMCQWFFGGVGRAVVNSDFRVGGEFRNEMIMKPSGGGGCSSGTDSEGEISRVHSGQYLEIVPPEKVVFTWNSGIVTNSRVTVELKDLGESTEIWITHDQLETEDLRSKHNGGWNACLENLEIYLENTEGSV